MPKNKMKSGTFIAMCVVTVLFIVMPLFLQVSVIRNAIEWILSGLKYQEYKSAYLGLVGGLLGSWLAITGVFILNVNLTGKKRKKEQSKRKGQRRWIRRILKKYAEKCCGVRFGKMIIH